MHPKSTRDAEELQDEQLLIKTAGRNNEREDVHHFPYEPTPYTVLRRLAESGLIGRDNHLIDYGAGKGRASFFLHDACGCRTTGIEFSPELHAAAEENRRTFSGERDGVQFILGAAERFTVPADADRFWFFNPFSVKVLRAVTARIRKSCRRSPREAFLFFYYPEDDAVSFLMTCDGLMFYDEIDCSDLFPGNNPREKILIFEIEA